MQRFSRQRLDRILERASGLKIAVVGDVMLDVYLVGAVSRISPEAPVPVVHVAEERTALGGAANVAANVAALGAACQVVGVIGRDTAGTRLRETLQGLDGGRVTPTAVSKLITLPTKRIDEAEILLKLASSDAPDKILTDLEPSHAEFARLKKRAKE